MEDTSTREDVPQPPKRKKGGLIALIILVAIYGTLCVLHARKKSHANEKAQKLEQIFELVDHHREREAELKKKIDVAADDAEKKRYQDELDKVTSRYVDNLLKIMEIEPVR